MKIGIPRALYYYRYKHLWTAFFEALGCEVVLSPETDRKILQDGISYAIDEACLSSKIFLGHVAALIGKCDYIFIPRIDNFGKEKGFCTKFQALHDIVANTFREESIRLISYNIDLRGGKGEMAAFLSLGKQLGFKKTAVFRAYLTAKQAEAAAESRRSAKLRELLGEQGLKILIVAHTYNLLDKYIGKPVTDYLKDNGAIGIPADLLDREYAAEKSSEITETMPWLCNRELIGAAYELKDKVDGMILMSAFPCGPDSMVNEIITRRLKGIPTLVLTLDSQDGTAGLETRLESFLDIIKFKKEAAG